MKAKTKAFDTESLAVMARSWMREQFGVDKDISLALESYRSNEEWYFAENARGLCATAQVCVCILIQHCVGGYVVNDLGLVAHPRLNETGAVHVVSCSRQSHGRNCAEIGQHLFHRYRKCADR